MIPQAIILLGGKGTRIAARFPDVPKALVPVNGRPFLEWQLDWLRRGGVKRVHLAAGHKADVLEEYLATRPADGLAISLSIEPEPRGTGGAIKFAELWIRSDPFFVLNGDSLTPGLNFQALENTHRQHSNAWITIAVAPIEDAGRYGTVEFNTVGHVTAFREKIECRSGWINSGVYLMSQRTLASIATGRAVSIETDLFPALVEQGRIWALATPPPLLDMGTPDGLSIMKKWLKEHPAG